MSSLARHSFKLNTGAYIPAVGLGTWESKPGQVKTAVHTALRAGYRHLDCAAVYKNEVEVGEALASYTPAVLREDLFITSKVWATHTAPARVLPALERTLKDLQQDYLDLYLIHWPVAITEAGSSARDDKGMTKREPGVSFVDTWRAMEALLDTGKVKAIGVSNFDILHLKRLLAQCNVRPAVNQVELHPLFPQSELLQFCAKEGIHVSAYSPLGRGRELLEDSRVHGVAQRYRNDPAQAVLSWGIQRGTSVIPKSVTPTRIEDNLRVVSLDEDAMTSLDTVSTGRAQRLVEPSSWLGFTVFHGEGHVPEDL
ncbi:NADP-dependent oxidoreductase domain-containing protein [Piptocephalis cylindrospora]|uniref:NADP-dependent oxidoreductase domain-containing protein n=1 Tax=Piptocephalis cylindrospora TaxID=1907219 RepID=A0A4P9Y6J2_9FUNG|nr:NADP-dependent oxidoreductase domain-containing protein [Piptocephalis cylindrospora]|eukprot:RKP13851.1 NADP-dependent oxidoreductase domain-containing protein [Piptocephalis cylindrospora]